MKVIYIQKKVYTMIDIEKIKTTFKDKSTIQFKSMLNKHNDLKQQCEQYLLLNPQYQQVQYLINCIVNDIKLNKCLNCNKDILYTKTVYKNIKFCSKGCNLKYHRNLFLEKNGITNISQLQYVKQKKKQNYTNKQFLENREIKKKQTLINKYGENYKQIIKEKRIKTNLLKYNVQNCGSLKEVQQKRKNNLVEKYNVTNGYLIPEVKQKCCLSNQLSKGKTKHNIDDIINKIKIKFKDYVIPLFDKEQYKGYFNQIYKWKCIKCDNIFESTIHTTRHIKNNKYVPRCINCYPLLSGYSLKEKQIVDYIKTIYDKQIIENNKSLIYPCELDIYLLDLKLAIEFNGLYWHSSSQKRIDKDYHLNKYLKCKQKGIKLIQIFEDTWDNDCSKIKDTLNYFINNLNTNPFNIYLDNYLIVDLDFDDSEKYLNDYVIVDTIQPTSFNTNGYKITIQQNKYKIFNCGYLVLRKQ